jgi:hypothetical protein
MAQVGKGGAPSGGSDALEIVARRMRRAQVPVESLPVESLPVESYEPGVQQLLPMCPGRTE